MKANIINRRFLFFIILSFFASISFGKTIRVGIYDNPPKIYMDQNKQPAGIFVELLNEIAVRETWNLVYISANWNECLAALNNNEIDLMPDVANSIDRNKQFNFNNISVLESWSQVFVKPSSSISNISDLHSQTISLLKGSVQETDFDMIMQGFGIPYSKKTATSFSECFEMVSIDSADAAITNNYFGGLHYKKYGLKKTPIIFNPISLYFAVSKETGDTELLSTIDRYLKQWKNTSNSIYYKTLSKIVINPTIVKKRSSYLIWGIATALLLLAITIVIILILRKNITGKISDIKNTNVRLQEEKNKLNSYIENAPFGIFVTDKVGKYLDVNKKATDITGYDKKELLGMNLAGLFSEDSQKEALEHFQRVINTGKASGQFLFLTKSGGKRFCTVDAIKISEDRIIGFVNDVTGRVKAEQELIDLKNTLQKKVAEQTQELNKRIEELERFRDATIEREFRIKELHEEIEYLKNKTGNANDEKVL
ncbi:MAG: PAS domain S-box protein [Fidelibacterota bacterium]